MITVEGPDVHDCARQLFRHRQTPAWLTINPTHVTPGESSEKGARACLEGEVTEKVTHYRVEFHQDGDVLCKTMTPEELLKLLREQIQTRKATDRKHWLAWKKQKVKMLRSDVSCAKNALQSAEERLAKERG